jgi:hypothetical protein
MISGVLWSCPYAIGLTKDAFGVIVRAARGGACANDVVNGGLPPRECLRYVEQDAPANREVSALYQFHALGMRDDSCACGG